MAKLLNLEISKEEKTEFFKIGKIFKYHGIKGKLKIYIDPELVSFLDHNPALIVNKKKYIVEEFSFLKKNIFIIKLKNIDTIEEAEKFLNQDIYIESNVKEKVEDNNLYFIDELKGFKVISNHDQNILGIVENFYSTEHCSYLELNHGELIPFIKRHILEIDNNQKKIIVDWVKDYED